MSADYDIVAVTEDITYNDGASGSVTYCPPMQGGENYNTKISGLFLFFQANQPPQHLLSCTNC